MRRIERDQKAQLRRFEQVLDLRLDALKAAFTEGLQKIKAEQNKGDDESAAALEEEQHRLMAKYRAGVADINRGRAEYLAAQLCVPKQCQAAL